MKKLLLFIVTLFSISSYSQQLLPGSTTNQIVRHTNYTLPYNETFEQAEWVYYKKAKIIVYIAIMYPICT